MANAITAHTLINGSRNLVLQFNIVADGSGEYSDFTLLDLDTYTSDPNGRVDWLDMKVMKVIWTTGSGVSFQLKFGSDVNDHKLFMFTSELDPGSKDWTSVGGISSTLNTFDGTIRMSTLGFDTSADELSVTLWIKKKFK